jgi:hypothetical protein
MAPAIPPPLTGIVTSPRAQYLFPDKIELSASVQTTFSGTLNLNAGEASFLTIYKNSVLAKQIVGGAFNDALPIVKADARSRIHWRVDMLDHDRQIGGSQFLVTDCNFDSAPATVVVTLATTTITTAGQEVEVDVTTSPSVAVLLTASAGTFNADTIDGVTLAGLVNAGAGSAMLTMPYTHADNGQKTLTITAQDAGGNSQIFTFELSVNIAAPAITFTQNSIYPATIPGNAALDMLVSGIPAPANVHLSVYDGADNTGPLISGGNLWVMNAHSLSVVFPASFPAQSGHVTYVVTITDPTNSTTYVAGSTTLTPT